MSIKQIIRKFLWKIFGIEYQDILQKIDYVLLKNDLHTTVGVGTYDNGAKVWRWTNAPLTIGNYCSIAHNVNFIVDEGHHTIPSVTNFPLLNNLFKDENEISGKSIKEFLGQFTQREGISIGNDVWIGMGAFIMPGVIIGNGVTIAANAVVTKNVPDYTIVAGVPAKIIKRKYDAKTVEILNNIAWWNWKENIIKERILDFYSPINEFVKKYQ